MPDAFVLSESDARTMKEMVAWFRNQTVTTRRVGDQSIDHEEHPAPEVYIARTPYSGIPALSEGALTGTPNETGTGTPGTDDDVANYAECNIYRVLDDGALEKVDGLTLDVWNLSTSILPGSAWIKVTRDKFGRWMATRFQSFRVATKLVVTNVVWNPTTCVMTKTQELLTYLVPS